MIGALVHSKVPDEEQAAGSRRRYCWELVCWFGLKDQQALHSNPWRKDTNPMDVYIILCLAMSAATQVINSANDLLTAHRALISQVRVSQQQHRRRLRT